MSPGIANDLLMLCDDIGMGRVQRPDLLGAYITPYRTVIPYIAYLTALYCHIVCY